MFLLAAGLLVQRPSLPSPVATCVNATTSPPTPDPLTLMRALPESVGLSRCRCRGRTGDPRGRVELSPSRRGWYDSEPPHAGDGYRRTALSEYRPPQYRGASTSEAGPQWSARPERPHILRCEGEVWAAASVDVGTPSQALLTIEEYFLAKKLRVETGQLTGASGVLQHDAQPTRVFVLSATRAVPPPWGATVVTLAEDLPWL